MIHYLLMKSLRLYKRRLRERERVHHMFEEAEQRLDLIIAYGIEYKNSLAFRGSGSPFEITLLKLQFQVIVMSANRGCAQFREKVSKVTSKMTGRNLDG
ncbi:hypothetical protein ES319_A07G206300v1 [Gossypium barbadense]|uniref:Uncharacterized protein n=1 Tax=Gossypium barbadense TaxID=3634 RepID=A0A5J5V640_GOSBA|nr:hypothetical protein ES319_A07G206200v1 [Gossypium barbadense]KAB2075209.1 hypothetical protein ES319_A07G206300v1 [Gossypium barbadense]